MSYGTGLRDTHSRNDKERRLERELQALHEKSVAWALACCDWDAVEAEDVLQTAYLEMLEGRAAFAGRSSFRTFAFGVIRRVAASRRRRRAVRALLLGRFPGPPAATADPEADVSEAERAKKVRAALALLARRQREVLELVFYQGLTVEEAATVMDVSVGSARTHYHRGKERLLAALGDLS